MTFFNKTNKTNNHNETNNVDNLIWLTNQLDSIKLPKQFCLTVAIGLFVLFDMFWCYFYIRDIMLWDLQKHMNYKSILLFLFMFKFLIFLMVGCSKSNSMNRPIYNKFMQILTILIMIIFYTSHLQQILKITQLLYVAMNYWLCGWVGLQYAQQ